MSHLIDSDWVIDILRRRPKATRLADELRGLQLGISVITYGEVYEGVLNGTARAGAEDEFRRFIEIVDVYLVTISTMQRFARIRSSLRQTGNRLEDTDLLIAATALEHDLTLVTRNVNRFARVPGLRLC